MASTDAPAPIDAADYNQKHMARLWLREVNMTDNEQNIDLIKQAASQSHAGDEKEWADECVC